MEGIMLIKSLENVINALIPSFKALILNYHCQAEKCKFGAVSEKVDPYFIENNI